MIKFIKLNKFYLCFLFLSFYIIINTGIHSDDYIEISEAKYTSWADYLKWTVADRGHHFFRIFDHYLFFWAYEIFTFQDRLFFDFLKIIINFLSISLIFNFIRQYLCEYKSFIFAFFFTFGFIHDASIFWFMTSPYILVPAMIMYSHKLFNQNKIYFGSIFLLFSSFLSYSSPPYIYGLSIIFLIERKIKKFILFNFIGSIYILYYVYFGFILSNDIRVENGLNSIVIFKNLILQVISSFDSLFGISFFLKFAYSISYIDIFSIIILFSISYYFFKKNKILINNQLNLKLFYSFIVVYILSLIMFSLTGLYSQSTFNLGNRVTIYGSLFLSYLITFAVFNKTSFLIVLVFITLPALGLSNYWKGWNTKQIKIIDNINNNQDLKKIEKDSSLLIINNLYSNLGNINHVEFLIQPWVVRSIFKNNSPTKNIMALSQHSILSKDKIVDSKFNESLQLKSKIYIYDTELNRIIKVNYKELNDIFFDIDFGKRHWLQLINNKKINNLIIKLSPRLAMYFNDK